jgi:hypothetical protein
LWGAGAPKPNSIFVSAELASGVIAAPIVPAASTRDTSSFFVNMIVLLFKFAGLEKLNLPVFFDPGRMGVFGSRK